MRVYQHPVDALPYRRGIFQEQQEYNSLTHLFMNEKDKRYALKEVLKITDGELAHSYVASKFDKTNPKEICWSIENVDLYGRICILKYKGVEIALFIKRQLTKQRIDPEHPVSERRLKNPADAWMKLDLTGLSGAQAKRPTLELISKLERENEILQRRVDTQAAVIDQLEAGVKRGKRKRKAESKSRNHSSSKRRHSKTKCRSGKSRR